MTNFGFETLGGGGTGGGLTYLGTWNATTNTPLITSGVGTPGDYYIVDVAGNTTIDGISDWQIGDWIIFSSTGVWQKIDNSDLEGYNLIQDEGVALPKESVIDFQGAGVTASAGVGKTIVSIPATVTSVGLTAGTGISLSGTNPVTSSGSITVTNSAPDQTVVLNAGTGIGVSGSYPNFTITNTSPSSGGTVTSVTGTSPIASSGGTTPAISIADAVADGSTKGAASFNASDFNSAAGNISIDYTNGQSASALNKGFLTSTDWSTFNGKLSQAYQTVQDEGVGLIQRSTIDFKGTGVTATDDPVNSKTVVTIPDNVTTNLKTTTFGCSVTGGGFAPLTGIIGYTAIPYSGTITGWTVIGDVSGSCVIDVWKAAGVVPTVANTIAGTEKPTLSSQQLNSDNSLSTWTTAVTAGDIIGFYLDSASTLTSINLIITIVKS